jgi:hypothetical protein
MTEVFWVGFYTSAIAFVLALSRQIYKSKCKSFRCCGCELMRDTNAEEKIDELELERHAEEKSNDKV